MPINWNEELAVVILCGSSKDDYLRKEAVWPFTEANEKAAQDFIPWYRAKGGHRDARYYILPISAANALPYRTTDFEVEALDWGLKNAGERTTMESTMLKYAPGIRTQTKTRTQAWHIFMADLYNTYRDEVYDAGGTPDSMETFVTAIMTNPEAWKQFNIEVDPLVRQIKSERRKKNKDKRKRRLTTLVTVIAAVGAAIFLGPSIVKGAEAVISGASSATGAVTSLTSSLPTSASLITSATGLSPEIAGLISNTATNLAKAGANKDQVASAVADVAVETARDQGTLPAESKSVVPYVVGGIALTGLVALLAARGYKRNPAVINDISDLVRRYDDGDENMTFEDMVDELDNLTIDSPGIIRALNAYIKARHDNIKWQGRVDLDPLQDKLMSELYSYINQAK